MYLMTNLFSQTLRSIFYINAGLLTGLLILFCPQTDVRAANIDEEVFISADHMHLSIESGNSVYTGNVKISQGKLILTGDEITIRQDDKVIKSITVIGSPARYHHLTDDGETITAESEKMVYQASQNKLVMTINAILKQPDHRVSSQKIIYDTEKRIIMAGDKKDTGSSDADTGTDNNRVNITLTPKKPSPPKEEE